MVAVKAAVVLLAADIEVIDLGIGEVQSAWPTIVAVIERRVNELGVGAGVGGDVGWVRGERCGGRGGSVDARDALHRSRVGRAAYHSD
jgi:hypothetical protein